MSVNELRPALDVAVRAFGIMAVLDSLRDIADVNCHCAATVEHDIRRAKSWATVGAILAECRHKIKEEPGVISHAF